MDCAIGRAGDTVGWREERIEMRRGEERRRKERREGV
jgi:hypothetical protein